MLKPFLTCLLFTLSFAVVVPAGAEDAVCAEAVRALQPASVFGASASCISSQPAFCEALGRLPPERFETLATLLEATPNSLPARQMEAALSACGLDYAALHDRQCQSAYGHEEIGFVLRHCPFEAWALARAQCERNLDTISPRYYELCLRFGRPVP